MKISPLGALIVAIGAIAGIVIWIAGYIGLPNQDTHRNLAENPPVQSSVTNNAGQSTTPSGGGGTTGAGSTTGGTTGATGLYTLGKTPKTVNLNLISAYTTDSSGLNFNGFANGALKITVPLNWKVNVTFSNKDANIPHSVGFVSYANRTSMQASPVFPGAVSAHFMDGITASSQPLQFSFVANKSGKFAFICGVPGHDAGGMWDEFDVSPTAKAPTVTTPSGTVTVQ